MTPSLEKMYSKYTLMFSVAHVLFYTAEGKMLKTYTAAHHQEVVRFQALASILLPIKAEMLEVNKNNYGS